MTFYRESGTRDVYEVKFVRDFVLVKVKGGFRKLSHSEFVKTFDDMNGILGPVKEDLSI